MLVLARVSDILFNVLNKEATWEILNIGQQQGLSTLRTPVNTNNKKSDRIAEDRLTRSGLKDLQNFERSRGFDIDTTYLDLVPSNKRGKGKIPKQRRPSNAKFKWESLF